MTPETKRYLAVLLAVCTLAVVVAVMQRRGGAGGPASAHGAVLARVNGSPITQYDLESAIDRTLGKHARSQLGKDGRKKLLESLISSRAMAQAADAELKRADRRQLEWRVAAYREEQLVSEYLRTHARPEPVSPERVKRYYEEHPERFGRQSTRLFEMVSSDRPLQPAERDRLLKALDRHGNEDSWQEWATRLKSEGLPVNYRRGEVNERVLDARLVELMRPLKVGETSKLSFVAGRAYLTRITGEKQGTERPLSEVSAEIRESLGPDQLTQALRTASHEVRKQVNVEYVQ